MTYLLKFFQENRKGAVREAHFGYFHEKAGVFIGRDLYLNVNGVIKGCRDWEDKDVFLRWVIEDSSE